MRNKSSYLLLALHLWAYCISGQEVKNMALKDEKIDNPLNNYYIRMVKDDKQILVEAAR